MKLAIIIGTRPEIIKMAPIIRECQHQKIDFFILHTGQHYSFDMDKIFFNQLHLPHPTYNLDVGSGSHAQQTAKILIGCEKILTHESPDIVVVEGDTNTVLAGALAAAKLSITTGHVEAGLRSYNKNMPEEINRILTDHCSDYLFAPTEISKKILLEEGIPEEKIFITGNTIVDAVLQNLQLSQQQSHILEELELKKDQFFLVTTHRQENVDSKQRFNKILQGLQTLAYEFQLPVIYPIHPRAQKRIKEFNLQIKNIQLIDPLDYFSFLQLESNAKAILTDSGGVQEEACILQIPCITLRDETERPETLEIKSNIIAGVNSEKILQSVTTMLSADRQWNNPYGDGKAAEKIITILNEKES